MSEEDEETRNFRARLRHLKSTFRYDYEDEDEADNRTADSVSIRSPGLCCPLDHVLRLLNKLDFNKIRSYWVVFLVGFFFILIVFYMFLSPASSVSSASRGKTSVNLILAASKKIKFDLWFMKSNLLINSSSFLKKQELRMCAEK